jgi:NADH-quinone oxidoreductase subunit A
LVQYFGVFVLFALGLLFAALSFAASRRLGPLKPTGAKVAPYECGIVPTREPAQRFPVRFYLVAMIFIIFDIEIVFLYPWAVIYGELGRFGLVEMVLFGVAVVVAFAYLLANGALEWGPARRLRPPDSPLVRTTQSTVRRVGREAGPVPGEMALGSRAAAPSESEPAGLPRGHVA